MEPLWKSGENEPHSLNEKSPRQLRAALFCMRLGLVGEITTMGMENLDTIPSDRGLVIATTHLTDIDMPLAAYVLGRRLDIAMADMSLNHQGPNRLVVKIAGERNFFAIDFRKNEKGEEVPRIFNPDNFEPMVRAIKNGKRLMVAAYMPSKTREFTRTGNAVPYIAALGRAMILPVAVSLETDENLGMVPETLARTICKGPDVRVVIGEPMELPQGPDLSLLQEVGRARRDGKRLPRGIGIADEMKAIKEFLNAQSKTIGEGLKLLSQTQVA